MKVRNSVEELQSSKLWMYLNTLDKDYGQIACKFLDHITPILASIKDIFPFYTRHDAHHGFRVMLRMEQILDTNCFITESPVSFSKDELLLLICASYAHDLGMAVFPGEEKDLISNLKIAEDGWGSNYLLRAHLREKHSERGGLYIATHNEKIGIPQNLIFLLHKLMEAHNLSINDLDTELGKRFAAGSEEINLRQLACILCIADALEFSETRVVEGVLASLKAKMTDSSPDKEILISYQHNMQHVCIGNSVALGADGKIIFSGSFTDPDTMSLAHNTIDHIESWVRNYIDIDFESNKRRLIVRGDSIVRQLNIVGYDFERIGIRTKKENIIDLISSNATWTSDPSVVLRELLQNSVEACRYRKFHSPSYYKPQINVEINSIDRSINIIDNGCGMSRNIILNNFLTIANSRSSDPSYSTNLYSSIARFGIGFWSVFTIANKANISTTPFEHVTQETPQAKGKGLMFDVSIDEFKDYTVFKPIASDPGTSIRLSLKAGVNLADIFYKISYHIGCSEIPITIKYNEDVLDIPEKISLPSVEKVFGSTIALITERNVREFNYAEEVEEIDISVKLFYIQHDNKLSFVFPNSNAHILSLQDRSMLMKYRGNGICGFLFNYSPSTSIIDLWRIGYCSSNALNPKGFKFTLNRMGVMDSPQFVRYRQLVQKAIHNCYRGLLKNYNSFDAETIYRLNHQSRLNGGENPGAFAGDALSTLSESDSDLIAFKLYKIDKSRTMQNCDVSYVFYDDLIKLDYTLWLYHVPYYSMDVRALEQNREWIYQVIKMRSDIGEADYLLERTREADMIADCSPNGIIDATVKILSNVTPVPIRKFKSSDIDPSRGKDMVIGEIRGTWAGTIEERFIEQSNFIVLSQHHMVVKTGSELAADIKSMLEKDLVLQTAELIARLVDTTRAHIHPSVEKYLVQPLGAVDVRWRDMI